MVQIARIEPVHSVLIATVQWRTDSRGEAMALDGGRRVTLGDAMGGLPELDLGHTTVLQIRCGLHLHDPLDEGILIEGLTGGGSRWSGLATVKWLWETSVRSWGRCRGSLALVLPPTVVVGLSPPSHQVRRAQQGARRCGGEQGLGTLVRRS
jgi:hypothetical protein